MDYSEKYARTLKEYIAAYNHGDGSAQLALLQSLERRGLHKPTEKEKTALAECHRFGLKPTVR